MYILIVDTNVEIAKNFLFIAYYRRGNIVYMAHLVSKLSIKTLS